MERPKQRASTPRRLSNGASADEIDLELAQSSSRPTQRARMAVHVAILAPEGSTLRQPTEREACFLFPPLPCGLETQDGMKSAPGPDDVIAPLSKGNPFKGKLVRKQAAPTPSAPPPVLTAPRPAYTAPDPSVLSLEEVVDMMATTLSPRSWEVYRERIHVLEVVEDVLVSREETANVHADGIEEKMNRGAVEAA